MNIVPGFPRERADYVAFEEARAPWYRRRPFVIAAVAAVLLLALVVYLRSGRGDEASAAPTAPHVTVIAPGRQSVTSTVSATGTIAARREMPVGVAGEGGLVARVLVDAGSWVRKGQTLAVIERSVQAQQASQLAAQITAAQADARLAQQQVDRAQQLVGRGFVSRADLDQRIATRDAANARVRVAQAQLGEVRARIGRLDIRAPESGLVLTRAIEPGQIVAAGGPTLFRMAKDGELELQAQLAEADLARLRVGMPAEVTPVGTNTAFRGTIWQISPVIDPQTRQGSARIALRYDPALRPGGFASAHIMSGSVEAPLLPESAVQSDTKGNFVYIVGPGNKVVRREVKVGEVSDAGISIVAGLTGTERVVLSAGAFLSPGDPIIPELQKPTSAR